MAGSRRCLYAAAAGMVLVSVGVMVLEMEVFYTRGGSSTSVRLQHSEDIMINPAARLPNQGRLKRKNGELLPELRNDVGTRSVHNGAHQRERQRWLKVRAGCLLNGDGGGDCIEKGVGAVGASAEATTTEAAAAATTTTAGSGTAPQDKSSPGIVVHTYSTGAEGGVGTAGGGGGGDASSRIRAGAGGFRSMKTAGDGGSGRGAREVSARNSSHTSPNPNLSLGEGGGGEIINAGAQEKRKRHPDPHSHPGIERSDQEEEAEVEVAAPAGRNAPPRLLGEGEPAGLPAQGAVDGAERKAVAVVVDGAGGGGGDGDGGDGDGEGVELPLEERLGRLERAITLWGNTYVPPIAPDEKRRLIERWTESAEGGRGDGAGTATPTDGVGAQAGAPRILFVVTSFDRGRRLGRTVTDLDKLDYVLMIMDEIREACEAGFSPQAHLISAWDATPELGLFHDRLFCRRIGGSVPLTLEEHLPSIREVLAIKHRVYMKPRVKEFDLFLQLEDDMILTVNHILLYLQESEKLSLRHKGSRPMYDIMPGFVRVEPEPGVTGVGGEWFEWEVILSRFRGVHVEGAGTYLALEKSRVLPYSGNNQGFWMATQEQLKYLQRQCQYLRYTEASSLPFVEKFSGSLEMFSPMCHNTKVFPATHFEDFMVHHRTNNKNGKRGESTPAVSVSMIRLWAAQVVRDDEMLMEIGNTGRRRRHLR